MNNISEEFSAYYVKSMVTNITFHKNFNYIKIRSKFTKPEKSIIVWYVYEFLILLANIQQVGFVYEFYSYNTDLYGI